MNSPKVFLSHTDRGEIDRQATTALAVELRRVGIDVWLDRENPAPEATPEQQAAGPIPENPLFGHIVSALSLCSAVIYVASPASFDREYVRLEFDPRLLFQEFRAKHPDTPSEELPFYLALVDPLPNPPPFWSALITSTFAGRVLNLTGAGPTPLLLPTVLTTFIRDVAPERLLPLDPAAEWAARTKAEKQAGEAPGCPAGMIASQWRRLEGLLGVGPLFPGPLCLLDDDHLRYGLFRIGDTARIAQLAPPVVSFQLSLWTANIMLRSQNVRLHQGRDLAVEYILPNALKTAMAEQDLLATMAIQLQYGFGLVSSPVSANREYAAVLLSECRNGFSSLGASPLTALAGVLHSRASGQAPSKEASKFVENMGLESQEEDLRRLHHSILDASFPGPRLEATAAYHTFARSFQRAMHDAASTLKAGFAQAGQEQFDPEFWERKDSA
jgi:hypothetical protein